MRAVDIIQKKRDGIELSTEEIHWLIEGYVAGTVPDIKWLPLPWRFISRE